MARLQAGEISIDVTVKCVLGDRSDRCIAEAEYEVSLHLPGCSVEKISITDDQPDSFYGVFSDALERAWSTVHDTIYEDFSVGVYPSGNQDELAWHTLPIEPEGFVGDPENAFKVIVCLNPHRKSPLGSGIAAVVSVSRDSIRRFLENWVTEMEEAPRSDDFRGEHLLRWLPNRKST